MKMDAKVTSRGQLTLPVDVQRRLGVKPGDRLIFEPDDDGYRVRVARQRPDLSTFVGKYRVGPGKTAKEVNRWLHELRGHNES
ncbi:AbrB/MazE/SpoVT family DNA-binding domain-containing protein [bacterium]|nr:MAG: AbrB/MazE/SpoVT family DNA-binding domain-containing protein [bacterium]